MKRKSERHSLSEEYNHVSYYKIHNNRHLAKLLVTDKILYHTMFPRSFRVVQWSILTFKTWSPSFFVAQNLLAVTDFLDVEGGSQKATIVVVLLVVVISSLKIPKAFLMRSGVQLNFAYTFVLTLPTDLPSQIFHLFSNLWVIIKVFHVISLKLDIEPSLLYCRHCACSAAVCCAAWWAECRDEYLYAGGRQGLL